MLDWIGRSFPKREVVGSTPADSTDAANANGGAGAHNAKALTRFESLGRYQR